MTFSTAWKATCYSTNSTYLKRWYDPLSILISTHYDNDKSYVHVWRSHKPPWWEPGPIWSGFWGGDNPSIDNNLSVVTASIGASSQDCPLSTRWLNGPFVTRGPISSHGVKRHTVDTRYRVCRVAVHCFLFCLSLNHWNRKLHFCSAPWPTSQQPDTNRLQMLIWWEIS